MKPVARSVEAEISALPSYEETTILYSPASLESSSKWLEAMANWYAHKGAKSAPVSIHMLECLAKQLRYAAEKLENG